ncbi:diacylglycerol kinase [Nocardioides marmoraquaticus]
MAQQIVVISNPTSGRGTGARVAARTADLLRARGHEVVELAGRDAEEAEALVRRAVADGPDLLVVVGGDGMVHLALQAVSGSDVRLGLVPAGTGNDVARYLDVPRGDVSAAVGVLLDGEERRLDVAVVEAGRTTGERRFLTVMAAGFDAVVNERANAMRWPRGQARYTLATLAELRTLAPIPYVLELDGRTEQLEATMVAVGNGPSFGGGLRITEGAELDDGLLDVVVIAPMSRRELVRTYPKLFRGTHVDHPSYSHHRVRQVRIEAPGITAYADGERVGALPLSVGVEPRALRVVAGAGR